MNRRTAVLAVLVAIITGGCQGFHFDGVLDVEPVSDPSDEGQSEESTNEDEKQGSAIAQA
jgi:hypothetical protein